MFAVALILALYASHLLTPPPLFYACVNARVATLKRQLSERIGIGVSNSAGVDGRKVSI